LVECFVNQGKLLKMNHNVTIRRVKGVYYVALDSYRNRSKEPIMPYFIEKCCCIKRLNCLLLANFCHSSYDKLLGENLERSEQGEVLFNGKIIYRVYELSITCLAFLFTSRTTYLSFVLENYFVGSLGSSALITEVDKLNRVNSR